MIQMRPVASSNLASVGYDPERQELTITFQHGGTYVYSDVPEAVYLGLMGAGSKGQFHAAQIKFQYPYRRR